MEFKTPGEKRTRGSDVALCSTALTVNDRSSSTKGFSIFNSIPDSKFETLKKDELSVQKKQESSPSQEQRQDKSSENQKIKGSTSAFLKPMIVPKLNFANNDSSNSGLKQNDEK